MTTIDDLFRDGGLLSGELPGYRVRGGQYEAAQAVCRAVAERRHVLVEAGTGVGKSQMYLAAAILGAREAPDAGEPTAVVVATANRALQRQLLDKDLPVLQRALERDGVTFSFALSQGIGNYLCRAALEDAEAPLDLVAHGQLGAIRKWAERTRDGDLDELDFEPVPEVRRLVTVSSDECTGKACPHADACYALRARAAAKCADVVVTNYAMLASDVVVRGASGGALLPEPRVLVCDEAHRMAESLRSAFGSRITAVGVRRVTRLLAPRRGRKSWPTVDGALYGAIEAESRRFGQHLENVRRARSYKARLRVPGQVRTSTLADMMADAGKALGEYRRAVDDEHKMALRKAAKACAKYEKALRAAEELAGDDVYYIDAPPRGGAALMAVPLDVARGVREAFFDKVPSVVLTSATLCDGPSSFRLVRADLGVPADASQLQVQSPFENEERCLVVVPKGLPDPKAPDFRDRVAGVCLDTVRAAEGRTLCLFTSWRGLEAAHRRLVAARLPWAVHRQGDAPRGELVRRFRADERSVLLGVASLWEGIDVQGEALSCVFIDKLPFASPEDPIASAVTERNPRGWFAEWSLPRAVITLKQGVGRLVRTEQDRGVVVIGDRRVVESSYGERFLSSLPAYCVFGDSLDDVGPFIDARAARSSSPESSAAQSSA